MACLDCGGCGLTAVAALVVVLLGWQGAWNYIQVIHAFASSPVAHQNNDGLGLNALYRGWIADPQQKVLDGISLFFPGLVGIYVVMRYRLRPPAHALALLTCAGALLLPYSHQYDSIALIPALFLMTAQRPSPGLSRTLLYAGMVLIIVTPLMAISSTPYSIRLVPVGLVLSLLSYLS